MTDFDPWHTAQVAADVLATGRSDAHAWQSRQRQRLAELLDHARQHTRLHAERLKGVQDGAPLTSLPVLDKATLMARFDDGVSDPELTLASVRGFIADPARIGTPLLGRYVVWESSGTSGLPGYFVQDARAMAVYDSLEALRRPPRGGHASATLPGPASVPQLLDPFGLWRAWGAWVDSGAWDACSPWQARGGAGDRWAFVGVTDGHFASQVSLQRLCRLNPWLAQRTRSFSIMQPLPTLLQALNDWQPTVLATYPTAATMLAEAAGHGALRLPLREVLTGGETLADGVRQHLSARFRCPVHNSYGASECLTVAADCAHGRLHLNADWVILEPVDEHRRPVVGPALSHSTLLTNLANRVQPLIRYDLGDRVRVLAGACACGSALPAIEPLGRQDDALHMAGSAGALVTLLPLALSTVLEEEAGVFDFQLLQRGPRAVALRLGDRVAGTALTVARCRDALRAFARQQGVPSLRVLDETPQAPLRGRSGKVARVVALPQAA
jgi:phenylacetate-coenzyme A ligase PaaK-like adenylate-forming protein